MSQPSQEQQPPAATPVAPVPEQPSCAPRPARSKNGCNACRRRKVRCNEKRPRCGHCERLNLECTWNRPVQARSSSMQSTQSLAVASPQPATQHIYQSNVTPMEGFGMNGSTFFDFTGPLGFGAWDEAMLLSPNSWPADPTIAAATSHLDTVPQPIYQLPLGHQSSGPLVTATPTTPRTSFQAVTERPGQHQDPASTSPFSHEGTQNGTVDGDTLVNTFLQMLMPPILTPVEIGTFLRPGQNSCSFKIDRLHRSKVGIHSSVLRFHGCRSAYRPKCDHGFCSDANATKWIRRRSCESRLEASVRYRCSTALRCTHEEKEGRRQ